MTTPRLRLFLFGAFAATVDDLPVEGLPAGKSQALLALLALRQDRDVPRAWIAATLWPDSAPEKALFNLRQRLAGLRRTLGAAAPLLRSPDPHTLRLAREGVFVDTTAFDAAVAAGSWEEALALYRGTLLEGWAAEWVLTERTTREESFLEALEHLAGQAVARGDFLDAIHRLRRLIATDPYRESAHRALMQALSDHGDPAGVQQVYRDLRVTLHRDLNLAPDPETDALYQRLQRRAEALVAPQVAEEEVAVQPVLRAHGLPRDSAEEGISTETFLPRERRALEVLVARRLCALSQKDRRHALALSVFPCAFTPEQAAWIAGVESAALKRLTVPCLIVPDAHGYLMRPLLRAILWRRLTEAGRERLGKRHAAFFHHRIVTPLSSGDATGPDGPSQFKEEESHYRHAVEWHLTRRPSRSGIELILMLHHRWDSEAYREGKSWLHRASAYLEEASRAVDPLYSGYAALLRARFSMDQHAYDEALRWGRNALAIWQQAGIEGDRTTVYQHVLAAAHHAGDDDAFDRFQALALAHQPPGSRPFKRELYVECITLLIAENDMARRRFDKALAHNDQCFALREMTGHPPDELPVLWNQRAQILAGMGRGEEAESAWDKAITGFEATGNRGGVAGCYEQLGALAAKRGQVGLGLALVQQAMSIFEEVGNPDAVAAAKGTLAGIYRQQGQIETARTLLNEGLAYWEASGHPRWIERFQERLQRVDEQAASNRQLGR